MVALGAHNHRIWKVLVGIVVLLGSIFVFLAPLWAEGLEFGSSAPSPSSSYQTSKDIFYQTEGIPTGPPAPRSDEMNYFQYKSLDNRILVWFVTQQHTYFGGFVLALPIFCLIFELVGLMTSDRAASLRYDWLARDFLKVSLLAFSMTALLGAFMLGLFLFLYPSFMSYMGGTFRTMMPVYALVFLGETFCLLTYYYSWDLLSTPARKWGHAALGVLTNVLGTLLLFLANAWAAFMMAPAGVDSEGRFLGNTWHLLNSALWNPLNAHRFLADIMLGGSVVMAYAAYRFFTTKSEEERAYYDWVGYRFLIITVCALLPMPFAGYWLMKTVFAFRQSMGMTMMGGLLTWLFVIQALLVGVLFLGINYYLWQRAGAMEGGKRYQPVFKALVLGLTACLLVWFTPHTLVMSATEVKAVGGAQHPVIGNYGVMSAKNGAINIMICLTAISYMLFRRVNRTITVPWEKTGNYVLVGMYGIGILNIIWLAVYGFFLPANVRVGLSFPQACTTLTLLFVGLLLNRVMLKDAVVHEPVQWGRISVRGMATLFGLAAAFTWVMGLMGYIRSSGRLSWHVSEVMPDLSPWAFTPTIEFASKMVTLNLVVFWLTALLLFWISSKGREPVSFMEPVLPEGTALLPSNSREVQPS